jgi:hypothetical protein
VAHVPKPTSFGSQRAVHPLKVLPLTHIKRFTFLLQIAFLSQNRLQVRRPHAEGASGADTVVLRDRRGACSSQMARHHLVSSMACPVQSSPAQPNPVQPATDRHSVWCPVAVRRCETTCTTGERTTCTTVRTNHMHDGANEPHALPYLYFRFCRQFNLGSLNRYSREQIIKEGAAMGEGPNPEEADIPWGIVSIKSVVTGPRTQLGRRRTRRVGLGV